MLLLLACCLFVYISTNFNGYNNGTQTLEDAHIQYRFAKNLAEGKGLVFNEEERLEGYSVLLWILYLAFWNILGIGPIITTTITSVIAGILLMVLLFHQTRKDRDIDEKNRVFMLCLIPSYVGLNYYFMYWVLGGFETLVFALLLLWILFRLTDEYVRNDYSKFTIVLIILAYLLRAEGSSLLLFALLIKFLQCFRTRSYLDYLTKIALPFLTTIVAFMLWRFCYYGEFFSNVFYSKCFQMNHFSGLDYYHEFVKECGVSLVLFCSGGIGVLLFRKGWTETKFMVLFLTLFPFQHFLTSGDHWPYYKYIIPILPLFLFLSLKGWLALVNFGISKRTVWFVGILLFFAWQTHPNAGFLYHYNADYSFGKIARNPFGLIDREVSNDSKTRNIYEIGTWLRLNTPENSTVALIAAGIIPYYADRRIIDYLGLLDREVTKLNNPIAISKYLLNRMPEYILINKYSHPPQMMGESAFSVGTYLLEDPLFHSRYFQCNSFPFIEEELNFPMVSGMDGKRVVMDLYCLNTGDHVR